MPIEPDSRYNSLTACDQSSKTRRDRHCLSRLQAHHCRVCRRGAPCVALGTVVLFRGHSFWQLALGLYFISLGINYVPLLVYAVAITRGQSARAEMGDELSDERWAMAKYRRQSILLLVPLLVPILASSLGSGAGLRQPRPEHSG